MKIIKQILVVLLLSAAALAQGNTTKIRAVTSLPATCIAGDAVNAADEVALVSGGNTVLYICKQTNTWNQVGGAITFDQIGAGTNTTAAMVNGTGSSLKPSNSGQVASSQLWLGQGLSAPVLGSTSGGGTIPSGHNISVRYTLVTAAGETLASIPAIVTTPGANSFVTVTAPTIPSGYTGYTVYSADNGAGGSSGNELKQTSNSACVNITGNCQINAAGVGSALPTTATAYIQPTNVQAFGGPNGMIPWAFVQKADGNYYPWLGVEMNSCDASGGPPLPCGTPEFIHRTYFNDIPITTSTGGGLGFTPFKNSFVTIDHQYGNGTVATNQDRALSVLSQTPANDSASRYAVEGIQAEMDFNCNGCTINGSPDAEVTTISGQMSTANASTNWTTTGFGTNVGQFRFFRSGAGIDNSGMAAVYALMQNSNATASSGAVFYALRAGLTSSANAANATGIGVAIDPPTNTNLGFIDGITAGRAGTFSVRTNDRFIDQRVHNWHTLLNSDVGLTEINNTDGPSLGALPIDASPNVTGGLETSQIASSWTTGYSAGCSGGASTYTYTFVAVDANGGQVASASFNCTAGTNPLTSGNPATLNAGAGVQTSLVYRQAVRIDVYRTGGPMATGKIGSLTCNNNIPINSCATFSDTGLSASGSLPSGNTTGGVFAAGDLGFNLGKGQHFDTQAANNDFAGTCTLSSGSCTVTFTRAYASAPACIATPSTTGTFTTGAALKVNPGTTSVVITSTTGTDTAVVDYACFGNPN